MTQDDYIGWIYSLADITVYHLVKKDSRRDFFLVLYFLQLEEPTLRFRTLQKIRMEDLFFAGDETVDDLYENKFDQKNHST